MFQVAGAGAAIVRDPPVADVGSAFAAAFAEETLIMPSAATVEANPGRTVTFAVAMTPF
jgi:hypothetical protein